MHRVSDYWYLTRLRFNIDSNNPRRSIQSDRNLVKLLITGDREISKIYFFYRTIRNNQKQSAHPYSHFFILPIVTDGMIFPLILIQSRNTFCSPRFLPTTLNINPSNQKNFSLFLFFSLWKNHSIFHRSNLSRSALSKSHLPR